MSSRQYHDLTTIVITCHPNYSTKGNFAFKDDQKRYIWRRRREISWKEKTDPFGYVIWLGHACFLLRSDTKSLMFDPFKGTGLPEPKLKADIVLCSHSHSDHNNVAAVKHEKS